MEYKLLVCPFCGGDCELETEYTRLGYGEYETTETYHSVICKKCKSSGTKYLQRSLIDFTKYTVSDFRNNPILRAKVEDDYTEYCLQTKQLAIEAWNTRV